LHKCFSGEEKKKERGGCHPFVHWNGKKEPFQEEMMVIASLPVLPWGPA